MSFIYASKKAEKIVGALYRASDFVDDKDPLKEQMRTRGLLLLERVYTLPLHRSPQAVQEVQRTIKQMISLIEVAHSARFISIMNRTVFISELRAFGDYLDEKANRFAEEGDNIFTADSFVVSEDDIDTTATQPFNRTYSKGHKRGIAKGHKRQVSTDTKKDKLAKKTSRKDMLLNSVKQMGKASLKDIARRLPEVSEKTIQRDITELLETNVLKKHGKRRWSVYFLSDGGG
jgi:hypothetical protein